MAKKAAYYISDEDRAREVTTPGGGGDKVRYFPYRDLEAGLYKVLSATFASIAKLNKAPENEELNRQGIVVVVTPRITTHPSSDSIVTVSYTHLDVYKRQTGGELHGPIRPGALRNTPTWTHFRDLPPSSDRQLQGCLLYTSRCV